MDRTGPEPGAVIDAEQTFALEAGWEVARTAAETSFEELEPESRAWLAAEVPGTAAAALRDAGLYKPGDRCDFDAEDWWFRTRFARPPVADSAAELALELDGIATVAEVLLNGEPLLESSSMFASHSVEIGERLADDNELVIHCRALAPLLRERRRPRARWRTRLVAEGNLRFFRTSLLGRAPGFAPGPAAVGPWRPVRLRVRRGIAIDRLRVRSRLVEGRGSLSVEARLRALDGRPPTSVEVECSGPTGTHRSRLELAADDAKAVASGVVEVPEPELWWPHTHGAPALYDVRLIVERDAERRTIDAGRVGFRSLAAGPTPDHRAEADGLDLHLNGVAVFARGAIWTPVDAVGLAPQPQELRAALDSVRDAGMNMVRVPGIGAYESPEFHDLCDELGILVWQDFMFANLDYPIADDGFRETVDAEADAVLEALAGRPSLAVLCGNSEVEQQAAMLGLEPELGRGELFGELLPRAVEASGADAPYLPSAPCGGELPFRTDRGVANYFGVGAYLRPLADARAAAVKFASECLAFANVPDEAAVLRLFGDAPAAPVHDPRWKAAVPRDSGAGWDFDDVRDHYLRILFGVDPAGLRWLDPERYLELSRAVSGEVMAEVFGEWRRAGSPCAGGLVLWMRDLVAGAGWGLVDELGAPKVAYHHLRRALAPVAVWTTDEGLNGIAAHVANDLPQAMRARLRVALYRDGEQRVDEAQEELDLAAHSLLERDIESLFGRFLDLSWSYRFGPPAQDLIVVSIDRDGGDREPISQAVRFCAGRPVDAHPAAALGLEGRLLSGNGEEPRLVVGSRRLAYGVRIHAPGFAPGDDSFSIEPGGERTIRLRTIEPGAELGEATLTALNLSGRVRVRAEEA